MPSPSERSTLGTPRAVPTPAALGALVRKVRRQRGWSQAQLAAEAGVGRRFIIELEGGKASAALGLTLRAVAALGLEVTLAASAAPTETGRISLDEVLDGLA